MKKTMELKPIKESTQDFEKIERKILELFKKEIYLPLVKELGVTKQILKNASDDDLLDAISSGRITFYRGSFTGRFSASVSRELKRLGAKWDRKQGAWKVPQSSLPLNVKNVISSSEVKFQQKMKKIDDKLAQLLPEEIADRLKISENFDSILWKTDENIAKSIERITVTPRLSDSQRHKISEEWQNNMQLWIKDWTQTEIVKLREQMQKSAFTGNRYESMISKIQKSYDVSHGKAKFLARQETGLLMAKFKETRYTAAGVNEYKWGCVAGTGKHPVRPAHKKLEGKIFRWDNPPITDEKGNRNNPGEDYNCRCFAKPIVRF